MIGVETLATDIPTVSVPYSLLLPLLIMAGTALLGLILEAALPRAGRFSVQATVAALGTLGALVATVNSYLLLKDDHAHTDALTHAKAIGTTTAGGALSIDGPGVFTWGLLLVLTLLSLGLFAERRYEDGLSSFTSQAAAAPGTGEEAVAVKARLEHTEVFPLAMLSVTGMMLFATASDLITMFVALEVLSLPLYVLTALSRRRRLISQEAALKYFLLGAYSSVFFLFGSALAYGFSGSLNLTSIDAAISSRGDDQALLLVSAAMIGVGLLFKIGAVPFHNWTPDVYQGAPTPVTAFMASATKTAAFIALMRVFFVAFGGLSWDWRPVIWVVAVITMLLGAVVAISQTDVKRMLAYSSISHAGFLLVGLSGAYLGSVHGSITSVSSVLFYLFAYGVATIGAFAVVMVVRDTAGESTHLSKWAGLGKESPWLAGAFAVFMLSFAGIPLTAGFIGKWTVFAAAWSGGTWPLVLIGALISAIAAYFYVRVIVLMFFTEPVGDGPTVAVPGVLTTVVIALAVVATVIFGVLPGPVLDLAQNVGVFVR